MGDRNGAMSLAFGISAALLRRERTGSGSVVDVSLLATAMWTLSSATTLAIALALALQPLTAKEALDRWLVPTRAWATSLAGAAAYARMNTCGGIDSR